MLWPMIVGTEPLLHVVPVGEEFRFYAHWFDRETEFFDYWFEDSALPANTFIEDVEMEGVPSREDPEQALVLRRGQLHALTFRPMRAGSITAAGCLFLEMRPALKRGGLKLPINVGRLHDAYLVTHEMVIREGRWARIPHTTEATEVGAIAADLLAGPFVPHQATQGDTKRVARGFITHVEVS